MEYHLRQVVEQFTELLTSRQLVEQDRVEIVTVLQELADVKGDTDRLLREHPALYARAFWFYEKYRVIQLEAERVTAHALNENYSSLRKNGYDEWTAKRMAEINSTYLKSLAVSDACASIVNVLAHLPKLAEQRLRILEQLSNNYRAEMRSTN